MLKTTDLVQVADSVKKDLTKYWGTFTRVYLSFSSVDELETETKEFDLVEGTKQSVELTSPKESTSKADIAILLKEAIQYFADEEATKDATKRKDPTLLLLKAADAGLVAAQRMEARSKLIPKVVNIDKATLQMAEESMKRKPGRFADIDEAVAWIKENLL